MVRPLGSAEGWGLFDVSAELPVVNPRPGGLPTPPLKRIGHYFIRCTKQNNFKSDFEIDAIEIEPQIPPPTHLKPSLSSIALRSATSAARSAVGTRLALLVVSLAPSPP
ncbi:hypothetical protein ZIOFF_070436 [Zingiber officinale]|uniref:Uncharacterized protein n=1 Tax=Zingiber officinale TaxID=94328 RepID=A0A8J5EUH4_ZINOF|nr:hypothetical protein ZIOFF_070436 [Zingiber officinale]